VYWTDNGNGDVNGTTIATGTTSTLATGQSGASAIAIDDYAVYWIAQDAGTVMKRSR
jgi:hypothetical protein